MRAIRTRALATSTFACFCLTMWLTAVPVGAQVPTGALAHWKFDDTAAPGFDSAGSYHAALFGNAVLTPAKNNSGLGLDGSDDYAKVSSVTSLEMASFAISAWINCTATDTNGGEIVSLGDNYGLRVRNSGVVRVFVHDTPTHWVTADSSITVCNGAWHHLVGQYDNSNGELELYIDGVARASGSATGISYTTGIHDLFIGHHGNGSALYDFNGRLDHIRIYNRALTDAEVVALDAEAPKILTWNLQKGRATNNSDSIAANTVTGFIKHAGPDVLLLSAVETEAEAIAIKNQLGGTWDVFWRKSSNSNEGQAILSRFQMPTAGGTDDRDFFQVTQSQCGGSENQVIVFAAVVIDSVRYSFFAIDQQHLSVNSHVRGCQAEAFRNWINSRNLPEPRIVAGDFNTDNDAGITEWTSPTDGDTPYFDGWSKAAKKFGYAAEGTAQGNTTGRTKKYPIDHIVYSTNSGVTAEAGQVWDARFLYPGTTCQTVSAFIDANATCAAPCTTCSYVDDKGVRPSDHIPFTLIISR